MRTILITSILLFLGLKISAQNPWTIISQDEITSLHDDKFEILPKKYQVVNLDFLSLKNWLENAPLEFTDAAKNNPLLLSLPMPDGTLQNFKVAQSPMMEPGLADKFPEIKTFTLQGIEDGTATGRMDFNADNFHAFVLSANGSFLINPAGNHYVSFFKKDLQVSKDILHQCDHPHNDNASTQAGIRSASSVGEELRTYRLAVSATGEYSNYHGGTVASALAAVVTSVNRINTVYERDVAVRLILIDNNDQIIYLDAATDPFSNGNAGAMLGENQSSLNNTIGSANYDIGHVFTTGGSGLAALDAVCGNNKARGTTGVFPPIGDFFDIDYADGDLVFDYKIKPGICENFNASFLLGKLGIDTNVN